MTSRIDPIGPYDRSIYPVRRVERDRRPADRDDDEQRGRQFEQQLDRGLREPRPDPAPPVAEAPEPRHEPPPDDGRPHIDISV